MNAYIDKKNYGELLQNTGLVEPDVDKLVIISAKEKPHLLDCTLGLNAYRNGGLSTTAGLKGGRGFSIDRSVGRRTKTSETLAGRSERGLYVYIKPSVLYRVHSRIGNESRVLTYRFLFFSTFARRRPRVHVFRFERPTRFLRPRRARIRRLHGISVSTATGITTAAVSVAIHPSVRVDNYNRARPERA